MQPVIICRGQQSVELGGDRPVCHDLLAGTAFEMKPADLRRGRRRWQQVEKQIAEHIRVAQRAEVIFHIASPPAGACRRLATDGGTGQQDERTHFFHTHTDLMHPVLRTGREGCKMALYPPDQHGKGSGETESRHPGCCEHVFHPGSSKRRPPTASMLLHVHFDAAGA